MSLGIEHTTAGAPQHVIAAIKNASKTTGVDFDYLVNQARTESSFRPDVKAKTSSATGLYQFIDQTWLATVSKHGSKHGLDDIAKDIQKDFSGRFFVSDDTTREKILNLRKDPQIASLMAAELASDNQQFLERKTGKKASATDLYLSHFLGASGAAKYITAMQETPYRPAAHLLPAAASSNKNIFYNSDGSPKSFTQIYNHFETKFGNVTEVQMAESAPSPMVDKSYRRDISFERMYGTGIDKFVRSMPLIDGFKNMNHFGNLFASDITSLMQNQVNTQSLFLTLTMLDSPK